MNAIRILGRAALVLAVLFESAVLGGGALNYWRAMHYGLSAGTVMPLLRGYGANFRNGAIKVTSECTVVRLTSRHCEFCALDEPAWQAMRTQLSAAGCKETVLLPSLADSPYSPRPGPTPELVWVPLNWASSVNMALLPTTLLIAHGRVVWARQGQMGAAGFAQLRARLNRLPNG